MLEPLTRTSSHVTCFKSRASSSLLRYIRIWIVTRDSEKQKKWNMKHLVMEMLWRKSETIWVDIDTSDFSQATTWGLVNLHGVSHDYQRNYLKIRRNWVYSFQTYRSINTIDSKLISFLKILPLIIFRLYPLTDFLTIPAIPHTRLGMPRLPPAPPQNESRN